MQFTGVPNGTDVSAFSLGSLPNPAGGEEIVGYDTDSALADTLASFLLASSIPGGDFADVSNLVAGIYQGNFLDLQGAERVASTLNADAYSTRVVGVEANVNSVVSWNAADWTFAK